MFAILSRERRASAGFTTFVVSLAIFTDVLIYGLVVPVLPFALADRVKLPHDQVQRWNSILLATYGGAIATGSSKSMLSDVSGTIPPYCFQT